MRNLKIIEHMSLDGVVQHSADENSFPYDNWTMPYRSEAGGEIVAAAHGDSFDLLLGRFTYDMWSGYWPTAPSSPMADRLNAATQYVVTHRPDGLEWGPAQALGPDIVEGVRRIKEADGRDIVVSGSSSITSALLGSGLADELVAIVHPVLLGTGKRLFAEGTPAQAYEFAGTTATSTGVTVNTYRVGAPLPPTS